MDAHSAAVDRRRLFVGSCVALISTSTIFAVIGAAMGPLRGEFGLSNAQAGWIGGAATVGFTIPMLVLGGFIDRLGMRRVMTLALVCHLLGVLLMILAAPLAKGTAFGVLVAGALVLAIGNGCVEGACNPLVTALYPEDKTVKLNQFHVWFPGGIVLGGLGVYVLDALGIGSWQLYLGLVLIPTVTYAFLFFRQEFPRTERVERGFTDTEMWRASLLSPFMLLMLGLMAITASVELGPNRWVPTFVEGAGLPGILVLVYISGLMAVLRYFAGAAVHRLQPTGVLLGSSVLAGVGLFALSSVSGFLPVLAAATIFALGVTYFWPTMLGVVAERNVAGGALALALMGGMGMAATGLVATPVIGEIADSYAYEELPPAETGAALAAAAAEIEAAVTTAPDEARARDLAAAATAIGTVAEAHRQTGVLPEGETTEALRVAAGSGVEGDGVAEAAFLLSAADGVGGRMAFRWMALLSFIMAPIFAAMWWRSGQMRRAQRASTDPASVPALS
ncbi:MAG: MFS transporter [Bacteroidota bacterium]